ncbi:MAG: hypothetical protein HFH49_13135 [Lachnospiraceae bacterium]|nr:hypothetical protein [Lachnospiraceae bacterium]
MLGILGFGLKDGGLGMQEAMQIIKQMAWIRNMYMGCYGHTFIQAIKVYKREWACVRL